MSSDLRYIITKLIKFLIASVAVFWLLSQVNWSRTVDLLSSLQLVTLWIIIIVTVGEFFCRFVSLHVLFRRIGNTPFFAAVNTDLVVRFVNHLFPSRLSGQSLSPLVIRHYTGFSWDTALAVSGTNLSFHALLYGTVALLGLVLSFSLLSPVILGAIAISICLYLFVGISVVIAAHHAHSFGQIFAKARSFFRGKPSSQLLTTITEKFPTFSVESAETFRVLFADPVLWIIYGLTWAGRLAVFPGIRVWILLEALGITFSPAILLPVYLVMAYSVTLLPISPGGVGIAEATAVAVFVSLGIPHEEALLAIFLDRTLGVYFAAFAGYIPIMDLDLSDLRSKTQ